MNHPADTPARTIRARIHESAVKRVTRIYAATLGEILVEALQNSRRASATRVRISVAAPAARQDEIAAAPGDTPLTVTIADDGLGIADPAVLLSFGENGWDDATVRREDAAGFGFASLARRNCTVSSRPRSPDRKMVPSWQVSLSPEHFLGEADAEVHADETAPFQHGTAISFQATESIATIHSAAENAARHYPLPVVFENRTEDDTAAPEELPRRAFLDGAVHAERWRGLVFGVFKNRHDGYRDPDLSFFGLTLSVGLPTVETVHGPAWTVLADVDDCPDLELVLPARKEAVENAFLRDMREAARLAVYRAIAADPSPRPAFEDWTRARAAGIDIAPPPAVLRPWRPSVANVDDWCDPPKLAAVGQDALVMDCDPEPPEAQALWRAADRSGVAPRLFEADRRLDGYAWYGTLDRATAIAVEVTLDGRRHALDDIPLPERTGPTAAELPPRPDAVRIELAVRAADGPADARGLPADLAFAGEAWSWLNDALPLVTADSALQPHELAVLLRNGFFSPSDDSGADSYETQLDRFDEDALHLATRLLLSDDEACRTSIAEAVRRELMWLVPGDRAVDIRIRRPDITVTPRRRRGGRTMSRQFTVQCGYSTHYANTVTVEADTLEEALEKAVAAAKRRRRGLALDRSLFRHLRRCRLRGRRPGPLGRGCAARPRSLLRAGGTARRHAHRPGFARCRRGLRRPSAGADRARGRHGDVGTPRPTASARQQAAGHRIGRSGRQPEPPPTRQPRSGAAPPFHSHRRVFRRPESGQPTGGGAAGRGGLTDRPGPSALLPTKALRPERSRPPLPRTGTPPCPNPVTPPHSIP